MTIKEAQAEKRMAEETIKDLLTAFEGATGTIVQSVSIEAVHVCDSMGAVVEHTIVNIDVAAEL